MSQRRWEVRKTAHINTIFLFLPFTFFYFRGVTLGSWLFRISAQDCIIFHSLSTALDWSGSLWSSSEGIQTPTVDDRGLLCDESADCINPRDSMRWLVEETTDLFVVLFFFGVFTAFPKEPTRLQCNKQHNRKSRFSSERASTESRWLPMWCFRHAKILRCQERLKLIKAFHYLIVVFQIKWHKISTSSCIALHYLPREDSSNVWKVLDLGVEASPLVMGCRDTCFQQPIANNLGR